MYESVGQDKQYKEVVEAYDAEHGKYDDALSKKPLAEKLPSEELPKAPDPSPYK